MDPKSEQTAEATSKPPNEIYRTVKLNVGGFLFEVFRTLIEANESSMIAALVSERWNEDAQATIFIDRDGENFRYCLQFLRNGCVDLPLTISRDEFLRDMDYYGLDWKEHQVTHGAAVLKCLQEEFNCHLQKYGLAVKSVNFLDHTNTVAIVELQGIGTL